MCRQIWTIPSIFFVHGNCDKMWQYIFIYRCNELRCDTLPQLKENVTLLKILTFIHWKFKNKWFEIMIRVFIAESKTLCAKIFSWYFAFSLNSNNVNWITLNCFSTNTLTFPEISYFHNCLRHPYNSSFVRGVFYMSLMIIWLIVP